MWVFTLFFCLQVAKISINAALSIEKVNNDTRQDVLTFSALTKTSVLSCTINHCASGV